MKSNSKQPNGQKSLDSTDYRILNLLQQDAKYTNKEIAKKLGMTTTPVYERIKRLEEHGYIRKYVALVDRKKLQFQLMVFCQVSLKEHNREMLRQFEQDISDIPEVVECFHTAGTFDYLIKVIVRDIQEYQAFVVERLSSLENIHQLQSSFVLTEVKYSTCLDIKK